MTYNGVEIGRVGSIAETVRDGKPAAKFTLEVYPRYIGVDSVECECRYQGDDGVRR
ncbi:mce family virulence factor [Mycobacterium intracellulare 1956]|uniref:Mce family virulence factor n=1 Tax=Mycobacterium intracellulare 1956 TaxID=1299331 RepID=X8CQK8_MYCIT|nr:mce family virulence factor [Mycobacterium intracellulare 1956]